MDRRTIPIGKFYCMDWPALPTSPASPKPDWNAPLLNCDKLTEARYLVWEGECFSLKDSMLLAKGGPSVGL